MEVTKILIKWTKEQREAQRKMADAEAKFFYSEIKKK